MTEAVAVDLKQLEQWRIILAQFPRTYEETSARLKLRIRKGIPDSFRGAVWVLLGQRQDNTDLEDNSLNHLLRQSEKERVYRECVGSSDAACEADVIRDVDRTFPRHILFRERGELGQRQLFTVLRAVSIYHPSVGYCQGMGFVAGFLLMFLPEVDAFWMFDYLLGNMGMAGLPDLPLRFYQLEQLIQINLPLIAEHLKCEGVDASMFSSQWIMTLCTSSFPFKVLVRVWDNFLLDGFKMIFRVCLALLKIAEADIINLSFEQILIEVKSLPLSVNADLLIQTAFRIKVTRRQLKIKLITFHESNCYDKESELANPTEEERKNYQDPRELLLVGHTLLRLLPHQNKPDRDFLVTSLAWSNPRIAPCERAILRCSRYVPASQTEIIVGRKNGIVECHVFPDALACPQSETSTTVKWRRRFHMPSKIVLAAPVRDHLVVCLCENGEGALVNWDEKVWEEEYYVNNRQQPKAAEETSMSEQKDALLRENQLSDIARECDAIEWDQYLSLRKAEFPLVRFRIQQGRLEKSDGALEEKLEEVVPSFKLRDISIEEGEKPLWLEKVFRVPGPVNCASLSEMDRSKLVFGGMGNLIKVLDLDNMQPVFSAKNKQADCLGLTDLVEVTAVSFLDGTGENSNVLVVGTRRGRIQLYDKRTQSKPVLEIAGCHPRRSVVSITVAPVHRCQLVPHHCCGDGVDREIHHGDTIKKTCNEVGCHCFLWSCSGIQSRPDRGQSLSQSFIVTDNRGELYVYEAIVSRKSIEELRSSTSETLSEPPTKKRKWQPHKWNQYDRGIVVLQSFKKADYRYEIRRVHNLPFAMGSIVDTSWSPRENFVVGASISRYVHLWLASDRKKSKKIYLKNKLTKTLWSCSVPVQDQRQKNKDQFPEEKPSDGLPDDAYEDTSESSESGQHDEDCNGHLEGSEESYISSSDDS